MKLGSSMDSGSETPRSGGAMTISSVMQDLKEKFKNEDEDQRTLPLSVC